MREVRPVGGRAYREANLEGKRRQSSDTESLQTLCLCGSRFKPCLEEGSQSAGNKILSSDYLGAPWDHYCVLEHLRKGEVGGSSMTARSFTRGDDGHLKLSAVSPRVVDAACE